MVTRAPVLAVRRGALARWCLVSGVDSNPHTGDPALHPDTICRDQRSAAYTSLDGFIGGRVTVFLDGVVRRPVAIVGARCVDVGMAVARLTIHSDVKLGAIPMAGKQSGAAARKSGASRLINAAARVIGSKLKQRLNGA